MTVPAPPPAAAEDLTRSSGKALPAPETRGRIVALPALVQPLRDATWAQDARAAIALRQRLDAVLTAPGELPRGRLPGLALASAVLRGGLWREAAWAALIEEMATGPLRFGLAARFPGLAWLDLTLTVPRHQQDLTNLEPGLERLRWFPDVVTLSLLDRWRRARRAGVGIEAGRSPLALIGAALEAERLAGSLSSARLGQVAQAALEAGSGVIVPSVLAAAASGETPALSASKTGWQSLCSGPSSRPIAPAPAMRGRNDDWTASERLRRRAQRPAAAGPADSAEESPAAALERLLVPHARSGTRSGSRALKAGLQRLMGSPTPLPAAIEAVIGWNLALLDRGNRPRTLADYHAIMGRRLIDVFGSFDPREGEAEALGQRLQEVVDLFGYADRRHPLGRLADFAAHAARMHDWPQADLADLVETEDGGRMVRTAVLPWSAYRAIWSRLRRPAGGVAPELAEATAAAFVLLAWGGLRVDEVTSRVVADLDADLSVHVHATRGHSGKSAAARRRVPAGLFLPDEIAAVMRSWRAGRVAAAADPRRTPLFGTASLLAEDRVTPTLIRQRLRTVTHEMFGIPFTPHDLRHAWASGVQLLLALGPKGTDTIRAVTGLDEPRQAQIRMALMGTEPDAVRGAWQLSAMIGHRELSGTTTAHYVHLCDLGLGRLIQGAPERRSGTEAARMLGLRSMSLGGLPEADGTLRLEAAREVIVDRLQVDRIAEGDGVTARPGMTPGISAKGVAGPLPSRAPLTPELVRQILVSAEADMPPGRIALAHDRSEAEIAAVIAAARARMETLTAKRTPRLRSPVCQQQLMPLARSEARQQSFLARLLSASSLLLPVFRQDWVKPFFHQSDRHRAQLVFASPRQLSAWLGLFPDALPSGSFTVAVTAPQAGMEAALAAWRKELGPRCRIEAEATGRSRSRSRHGRAFLRIETGSAEGEARSFQTLRRAAFFIAVADDLLCLGSKR